VICYLLLFEVNDVKFQIIQLLLSQYVSRVADDDGTVPPKMWLRSFWPCSRLIIGSRTVVWGVVQCFVMNLVSIGGLIFTCGFTSTPFAAHNVVIREGKPNALLRSGFFVQSWVTKWWIWALIKLATSISYCLSKQYMMWHLAIFKSELCLSGTIFANKKDVHIWANVVILHLSIRHALPAWFVSNVLPDIHIASAVLLSLNHVKFKPLLIRSYLHNSPSSKSNGLPKKSLIVLRS